MPATETRSTLETLLRRVGSMNVLAISGGRVERIDENTVSLPVAHGYSVEVEYRPVPDLYEVRRVLTRRPKASPENWWPEPVRKVRGVVRGLYADQVGDAAYRASCYRDPFGVK